MQSKERRCEKVEKNRIVAWCYEGSREWVGFGGKNVESGKGVMQARVSV
jgi:hypothetical protein